MKCNQARLKAPNGKQPFIRQLLENDDVKSIIEGDNRVNVVGAAIKSVSQKAFVSF